MANIFTTQTPAFKRQSLTEFFLKPMFLGEDIRNQVTVRTGVKGTELLNHISAPSMITRKKTNPGFTPRGAFQLTTQEVTVSPMAIEFEQNAREFWDTIIQQLLASGYKEDDIEKMPESDFWNKIVLPMIARAGKQDLIRQMWFGDTSMTGSGADDWNGYNGFFKSIHDVVSSNNNLSIGKDASNGSLEVIISYVDAADDDNGFYVVFYMKKKSTGKVSQFMIQANESITEANMDEFLTNIVDGSVVLESINPAAPTPVTGVAMTVAKGTTPGVNSIVYTPTADYELFLDADPVFAVNFPTNLTASLQVHEGFSGGIEDDEVDSIMNQILDQAPPELLEFDPAFYLSYNAWRNLFQTWKNLGTDKANTIRWNGLDLPSYEGHPILIRPDWDKWDAILNPTLPGKILFTTPKNLLFATDGAMDSDMVESWYNQDEQKRRYRVQYKAATAVLHSELLLGANL